MTRRTYRGDAGLGDQPPLSAVLVVAAGASWRYLWIALTRPQPATFALAGHTIAVAALAFAVGSWWAIPVGLVVLLALFVGGLLSTLVQARRGAAGQMLLLERGLAGWSCLILRPPPGGGRTFWLLENMYAGRAPGRPPLDPACRPGALLLRRASALAAERGMALRLVAADQALAAKVYGPAGFVYADERQRRKARPRMVLPALTTAPPPARTRSMPAAAATTTASARLPAQ